MTDWRSEAKELKRKADELEYWATKIGGAGRMVLGRIADELQRLARKLQALEYQPHSQPGVVAITTEVFPVYGCEHVGDGVYEWYEVEVTYENGVPVSETVIDGPFTGPWQPGCPENEYLPNDSGYEDVES